MIEGLCALLFVHIGYVVLVNRSFDELEQSLGMIVCYLLLLTTLLAAGMMDYDGKKVPVHLFVPAFFGVLLSLAVSWDNTILDFPPLLAGAPLLLLLLSQNRIPWLIAAVITGFTIGWQLTLIVVGLSLVYFFAAWCFRLRAFSMLALFVLTWIMIVLKSVGHGA